jgi:hypothetical protein
MFAIRAILSILAASFACMHLSCLSPYIEAATRLLGLLEAASNQQALLEMCEVYNDAVNEPDFNIKEDHKRWNTVGH